MGCGSSSDAGGKAVAGPKRIPNAVDELTENMEEDYSKGVEQKKPVKTGPKNSKNVRSKNDAESDDSDGEDTDSSDASDDVEELLVEVEAKNDAIEAVDAETPAMDKAWQLKLDVLDNRKCYSMSQGIFFQAVGMKTKEAFRVCNLYGSVSTEKIKIDGRKWCEALRWGQQHESEGRDPKKTTNKILTRIMQSLDQDYDGEIDFREFAVLSAMMKGKYSEVDKIKFFWRIGLQTDALGEGKKDAEDDQEGNMNAKEQEARKAVAEADVWALRVPFMTAARIIRDCVVGGSSFVKAGASLSVGNIGATNAAPSKVLIRIKKQISDCGYKEGNSISFNDFVTICCKKEKSFGDAMLKLFHSLQQLMSSGHDINDPSDADEMRLAAFYQGNDPEVLHRAHEIRKKEIDLNHGKRKITKKAFVHDMSGDEGDKKYSSTNAVGSAAIMAAGKMKAKFIAKHDISGDAKLNAVANKALGLGNDSDDDDFWGMAKSKSARALARGKQSPRSPRTKKVVKKS